MPVREPISRTTDFSRSEIFKPSKTYRPFKFPWAVELWDQHEDMHWTKKEVDLGPDTEDWNSGRISAKEKNFASSIFRLFTQSDVNVGVGYKILQSVIHNNEINVLYTGNANREGTHQRNYSNILDTLNLPESEYAAFLDYKVMLEKHEFMLDMNVDTVEEFYLSLVKMIFSEGVTLFGSFVMLLSFKKRGLMQGMGTVIEWSIVDEDLHVDAHSKTVYELLADYPEILTDAVKARAYEIAETCVFLETAFIKSAFSEVGSLPNLSEAETIKYIRYQANRRLMMIGMKPIFTDVDPNENPLPWVAEMIQGAAHTNFFEKRVTEYSASGLDGDIHYEIPLPTDITIFRRDGCGYCHRAIEEAAKYNIPTHVIDLTDYDERQRFFASRGFSKEEQTMPKIYDQAGKLIGGFTEFDARIKMSPQYRETPIDVTDAITESVVFDLN